MLVGSNKMERCSSAFRQEIRGQQSKQPLTPSISFLLVSR